MLRNFSSLIILIFLGFFIWFLFYSSMPRHITAGDEPDNQFSTMRAFGHVKNIGAVPHYVGSTAHSRVRNYIVNELQELGLEVQTQEGYVLDNSGVLSFARNILARIPGAGQGKSLILMSHYDSAGHSSPGASDAASGIATILEGVRALLTQEKDNTNDIIILITDAEEIGLLGARLFVKNHPWAQNAGLALNFESRGSGGNSYMLLETNKGNASLIRHFKDANPRFPVTNSLAYSIYKMLPNDTDLTVLREEGDINGYNFAFIDDHFDYHTANDTPENLDLSTLAHQGSYLMPLLHYFKDADLSTLDNDEDLIYFTIPGGKIISYPFGWTFPLLIISFLFFLAVLMFGFFKNRNFVRSALRGATPFFISLIGSTLLVFLLWQFCLIIYPEYGEMEHGFTYNGYWYIGAMLFLVLTFNFIVYHQFKEQERQAGYMVFPLIFWFIICAALAFVLPGAGYFLIPAIFAVIQLAVMIRQEDPNPYLMLLLSLPALIILLPFITQFPVALGLKMMFSSAILLTFLFTLFLPVFGYFRHKKAIGLLCFLIFNVLFITAHFKSSFSEDRQKPNSLVYVLDADDNSASWNSYDGIVDDWTRNYFGDDPEITEDPDASFTSKYRSNFTYKAEAPVVSIEEPSIIFEQIKNPDSLTGIAGYSLKIAPNRKINRIEIFADRNINFDDFKVNGLEADSVALGVQNFHVFTKRWHNRLVTYHAANRDTLRIDFQVHHEKLPEFTLYEASYDLLENESLNVPARDEKMIPRPFVLNDAVIVKKTIRFEPE
jgi:hypothetical protein